jgi:tRNA(Ile)-lysidine synthase
VNDREHADLAGEAAVGSRADWAKRLAGNLEKQNNLVINVRIHKNLTHLKPALLSKDSRRFPWIDRVQSALAAYPKGALALVGVSGGIDSCVLLHLLRMYGFDKLIVCHLNHNLRGIESEQDKDFVAALCRNLDVPFHTETLKELPEAGSLETAARVARFEFFARAVNRFGSSSLFLAHHADDQIETFLFNLFRGTGSFGNAVIKPESVTIIGEQKLILIRPLLQVWKEQLREFAAAFHIESREDLTNSNREMTRNRIRHELIPEIERLIERPVKATLLRTIEVADKEGEFIRSHVPEFSAAKELPVRELRQFPIAVQRRAIHTWLRFNRIEDFGFEEVEAVRSLLNSESVAQINLPRNVFCRRRSGQLLLQFPVV